MVAVRPVRQGVVLPCVAQGHVLGETMAVPAGPAEASNCPGLE